MSSYLEDTTLVLFNLQRQGCDPQVYRFEHFVTWVFRKSEKTTSAWATKEVNIQPEKAVTGSAYCCDAACLRLRPGRQVMELGDLAGHLRQPGFDGFPEQATDGLKHLWNMERLFQQRADPRRQRGEELVRPGGDNDHRSPNCAVLYSSFLWRRNHHCRHFFGSPPPSN